MAPDSLTCPACRTRFRPEDLRLKLRSFPCPACGAKLQFLDVGTSSLPTMVIITAHCIAWAASACFSYFVLHLRGYPMIGATILVLVLGFVVANFIIGMFRRPKVDLVLADRKDYSLDLGNWDRH